MPNSRKSYPGVDVLKLVMACLVVSIHIPPFLTWGGELNFFCRNVLARIAVPFFFAAAGYLLFRKIDLQAPDHQAVKDYLARTLKHYGLWMVLLFTGSTVQLWFLSGLVVAVALLDWLLKRGLSLGRIGALGLGLYLLGLLGDSYSSLLEPWAGSWFYGPIGLYHTLFETTRNGLFMGFALVCTGAMLAKRSEPRPLWVCLPGLAVSLALLCLEGKLVESFPTARGHNLYLSLLPVSYWLLAAALRLPLRERRCYRHFRTWSTLIFYLHMLVYELLKLGLEALQIQMSSLWKFALTLGMTLLLAMLIDGLSAQRKTAWLKALYQ